MKYFSCIFGVSMGIFLASCVSTESTIATIKDDRNGDGEIDRIWYSYIGWEDRDYGFMDENFDGLFELKRTHGIAVIEEKLNPPLKLSEIENAHPEQE